MQRRPVWRKIHTITLEQYRALQSGIEPDDIDDHIDPEILQPTKERRKALTRGDIERLMGGE